MSLSRPQVLGSRQECGWCLCADGWGDGRCWRLSTLGAGAGGHSQKGSKNRAAVRLGSGVGDWR